MRLNMDRLRSDTVKWYVSLPLLGLAVILFALLLRNNALELDRLREEERTLRTGITEASDLERSLRAKVSNASSGSTVAAAARTMSFVTPDEICYEIENAESLNDYTQEEWNVMVNEWKLTQY